MCISGQEVVLQSVDELLRELLVRDRQLSCGLLVGPLCIVCILCFFVV